MVRSLQVSIFLFKSNIFWYTFNVFVRLIDEFSDSGIENN